MPVNSVFKRKIRGNPYKYQGHCSLHEANPCKKGNKKAVLGAASFVKKRVYFTSSDNQRKKEKDYTVSTSSNN
jgi:hypothetical protein